MSDWKKLAAEKLEKESGEGKYGRYEAAMKQAVKEAVLEFCKQNGEFAQAVAQGGSFADCMKAVAKNCGQSMSDLEAYKRAVAFYFKGATVRFRMEVDLMGDVPQKTKPVVLDLTDFL